MRRYGGGPNVLGRTIRVEDVPLTIIGVGPESFGGLVVDFAGPVMVTASVPADTNQGLTVKTSQVGNLNKIAVGDFNGDGQREIAGLQVQPDGSLKLLILTVDSTSLARDSGECNFCPFRRHG